MVIQSTGDKRLKTHLNTKFFFFTLRLGINSQFHFLWQFHGQSNHPAIKSETFIFSWYWAIIIILDGGLASNLSSPCYTQQFSKVLSLAYLHRVINRGWESCRQILHGIVSTAHGHSIATYMCAWWFFSLPAGSVANVDGMKGVCGALVQLGCYQHRYEWGEGSMVL